MNMNEESKAPVMVTCPTCASPVVWDNNSPWRPFCSKRCQLIDLDEWLTDEEEENPLKQD